MSSAPAPDAVSGPTSGPTSDPATEPASRSTAGAAPRAAPGPAPDARAGRAPLDLPRGQLLMVGTGAFDVVKMPSWVMWLRVTCGWSVRVCLTASADLLVSRRAVAAAAQAPVSGPEWDTEQGRVPHQELAEWADLVLVLPATVNFIGKCAAGIADDLALTTVMNTAAPVVIGPSVPATALRRPAVRRNLRTLREDGFFVVPPVAGTSVHEGRTTDGWGSELGPALECAAKALAAGGPV
ncbi:flavoprotein [Streptomyces sp. NPDC006544]|uniref:flavoprotein n=1 Tax=Streptomyces sp. NPDC006544 TaxID=3154583 RepID=UPI0033A89984